jgi:hypothetical protein
MDASRAKRMTPNKAGRMTLGQPMSTKRTAAFASRSFILPSLQALRIDVGHVDAFEQEDRDHERPSAHRQHLRPRSASKRRGESGGTLDLSAPA